MVSRAVRPPQLGLSWSLQWGLPAGLLKLRTGVFARWIVALIGAVAFLITFFTLIAGRGEDSLFGFGFFPESWLS